MSLATYEDFRDYFGKTFYLQTMGELFAVICLDREDLTPEAVVAALDEQTGSVSVDYLWDEFVGPCLDGLTKAIKEEK